MFALSDYSLVVQREVLLQKFKKNLSHHTYPHNNNLWCTERYSSS